LFGPETIRGRTSSEAACLGEATVGAPASVGIQPFVGKGLDFLMLLEAYRSRVVFQAKLAQGGGSGVNEVED
jgi:hypothetical protein